MRALNFEGGCDGSGDRKYMLYISLGEEEEFSVSYGTEQTVCRWVRVLT